MRMGMVLSFVALAAVPGCTGWDRDWDAHWDARRPTTAERAQVESVLRAAGYTGWEEVRFDDGIWLVGDAWDAEGREYDLRLDAALTLIERYED